MSQDHTTVLQPVQQSKTPSQKTKNTLSPDLYLVKFIPLVLHYGELYNFFIMYYNVIMIEKKVDNKCNVLESYQNHFPARKREAEVPTVWRAQKKTGKCGKVWKFLETC